MVLLRRFLTIPLGLAFLVLFGFALIILRLGSTFQNPDFYKAHLADADVYSFVMVDVFTSGIDELRGKPADFYSDTLNENPLDAVGLSTADMVSSLNRALPPAWVQEQVERTIDQAGGYLAGDLDSFEVAVSIEERVPDATRELKTLLRKSRLYHLVLDEVVTPEIDKALAGGVALPFNAPLDRDEVVAAVRRVVPEDWAKDQVDNALDEMAAYMVGDQETITIHVPFDRRADVALEEAKKILVTADSSELIFDEVILPVLEANLPKSYDLPFGGAITDEEVIVAMRERLSPAWLEEQALSVLDQAGPYLIGSVDSFRVVIPTAEPQGVALAVVEDLTVSKLDAILNALPECTAGQSPFRSGAPSLDETPQCAPPGMDAGELITLWNVDLTSAVADALADVIGNRIPDELVYTEADMRRAMDGSGGLDALDKARELLSQGWTYTEADLLEDQPDDSGNSWDDLRAATSNGWTYTDADLREDVASGSFDSIEEFREQPARARSLRFLVYLLLAALLALIGFLGGTNWWSRIAWAAATLGVASILALVASVLVFKPVVRGLIDDLRLLASEGMESPTGLLLVEKVIEVAQAMADDFLSGIARYSLALFVFAAVVFAAAFVRSRLVSSRSG